MAKKTEKLTGSVLVTDEKNEPAAVVEEVYITDELIQAAKERVFRTGDGEIGHTIVNMIRSRFHILYVQSYEEQRVVEFFKDLAMFRGLEIFQWDCDRGLLESRLKKPVVSGASEVNEGDPVAILSHIIDHATKHNTMINKKLKPQGSIYLLLDFDIYLTDMPVVQRKLKQFCSLVSGCTIVIVAPKFVCPPTLEKNVTLIDFPIPSHNEIKECLRTLSTGLAAKLPQAVKEAKDKEEDLVKAASGLTLSEAENAYAMSLVSKNRFDIQTVLDEKKQMIRKGGILEYREPRFKLDDLGGLDTLKNWIMLRRLAFRDDARTFGLPAPKGVLLLGVPGCGKSMTCDALADAYKMPLLRLDFGAVFSSHVGESEHNIRQCLKTAEAIAPAILWLDEIEKGIGGVESSNATDGGVTNRVFGTMLTWMQDKVAPVFVVCTANNIIGIPPEFMRAGRFDEVFYIDLPNEDQRLEIIEKLLLRKKRKVSDFVLEDIVAASPCYAPVEIEKGIDNALFVAFADNKRNVTTKDVVSELKKFSPLYNARREAINAMREWALSKDGVSGRAILANSPNKNQPHLQVPAIDGIMMNMETSKQNLDLDLDAEIL